MEETHIYVCICIMYINTCFAINFKFSRANIVVSKLREREIHSTENRYMFLHILYTYMWLNGFCRRWKEKRSQIWAEEMLLLNLLASIASIQNTLKCILCALCMCVWNSYVLLEFINRKNTCFFLFFFLYSFRLCHVSLFSFIFRVSCIFTYIYYENSFYIVSLLIYTTLENGLKKRNAVCSNHLFLLYSFFFLKTYFCLRYCCVVHAFSRFHHNFFAWKYFNKYCLSRVLLYRLRWEWFHCFKNSRTPCREDEKKKCPNIQLTISHDGWSIGTSIIVMISWSIR